MLEAVAAAATAAAVLLNDVFVLRTKLYQQNPKVRLFISILLFYSFILTFYTAAPSSSLFH